MKLEIVTIKDAKSREFNRPAFESSVESALRSFGVLCSEDPARSLPAMYPADFDLWHIGTFDTATGKLEVLPSPVHLANGVDVKAHA